MPRWISEMYKWILKEGYPVDDMIMYSIPKQKGKKCYRPKPGVTHTDRRRLYWYVGLKYESPLKDFVEHKIKTKHMF